MCTELPVFKRCCFCVPIRYGLLTWGYLKLITGTIGTIMLSASLVRLVQLINLYEGLQMTSEIIILTIGLFLALAQIALNILLVVGAHTKNIKLIRVYYIYSIVACGLTSVMLVVSICNVVSHLDRDFFESYHGWLLMGHFVSSFVDIALQIYILLVLRSEIIKLSDKRVQYNAAKAELTMEYKERLPEEGTWGTGDGDRTRMRTEHIPNKDHDDDIIVPSIASPALDGAEGSVRLTN